MAVRKVQASSSTARSRTWCWISSGEIVPPDHGKRSTTAIYDRCGKQRHAIPGLGVDIDKANEATRAIARLVKDTWGRKLSEIGLRQAIQRAGGYEGRCWESMDGVGTS
jgi:hypothetical protein